MIITSDQNKLNEFVDCLLEAFFDGAVNIEEGLPPGFSSSDIEDPATYVKQETGISEMDAKPLLTKKDKGVDTIDPEDMDTMLQKKKEFGGKADHETPYIHRSTFTVVDEHDQPIDLEKLKLTVTQRPDRILAQNNKIQKSGGNTFAFFNLTLPAYKGLWYDEHKHEWKIVTTCPSAGTCKLICYARKGGYVQFPVAFTFSARVLNFLLNDWQGFKQQLMREIEEEYRNFSNKGITVVIRWHDSGDFFNEKYLQIALDIARATPEVLYYAYTKQVGMVDKANKPKNFIFNYSMGGIQDKDIKSEHKKSVIVPSNLFRDIFPKDERGIHIKWIDITPEMLKTLRERLSKAYSIPPQSIITYKQLMNIPYSPTNQNTIPKYNVIVIPGNGDDAAHRRDVLTTMLFIH